MATFSTPPTEANQLKGILDVVKVLPDNTAKQITPKDFRDSVYTLWENTMYKPTSVSGSNIKYIGIDQNQITDPETGNNIYPKVYFGKKQTGGLPIMNDDLLDQTLDADFFFYSTKNNQLAGNYDTTISILAGTGSFVYNGQVSAPTLEAKSIVVTQGKYIDFNIGNNSFYTDGLTSYGGNINIKSEYGNISLNDFVFPLASEHQSASGESKNGYVLKYRWIGGKAYGTWESAFSQSVTTINNPSGPVTITGNPIILNGYRFTDNTPVATSIGGIQAGETFSNVDVLDMIRRIVYSYVPPQLSTSLFVSPSGNGIRIVESGDLSTYNNLRINWSVVINSTYSVTQPLSMPSTSVPPGGVAFPTPPLGRTTYTGVRKADEPIDVLGGQGHKFIVYTFSVTDTKPTTVTSNAKLTVVLPYFYGTSATLATQSTDVINLLHNNASAPVGKLNLILVDPIVGTPTTSNNQSLYITTQGLGGGNGLGYIYFAYPAVYPLLREIRDNNGDNGNLSTDAFATYSVNLTRTGYWSNRPYH